MAIANIEAELDKLYKQVAEKARKLSSNAFHHEMTINARTFSKLFTTELNKLLQKHFNNTTKYAIYTDIKTACDRTFTSWQGGGHNIKNVIFDRSGDHGTIMMDAPTGAKGQFDSLGVNRRFRKDVYEKWQGIYIKKLNAGKPKGQFSVPMLPEFGEEIRGGEFGQQLGKKVGLAHEEETNIAKAATIATIESVKVGDGGVYYRSASF